MFFVAGDAHVSQKKQCIFSMFIAKKYIRMGITIFKFFIWGGISSDIRSEILFYGDADLNMRNDWLYGLPAYWLKSLRVMYARYAHHTCKRN